VLHLCPDLAKHAIQHPKVNYISFTGSVAGGRDVDKAAAETGGFKTVSLEVGPE
jgi:acyl-CoA reductase-like NAD-dependent aldehyde dehydrogenase